VGLALDGTVISIDDGADADFYHKPGVTADDIMAGSVRSDDESARRFLGAVSTSTETQRQASAAPRPAAPGATPAPAPASAQSFPLADPKPGSEPK
jgi:hypothetical protein